MAAVLGTNIASTWAAKNLQGAQNAMANSVERLSSGLRINRAKDDAAGLAISSALTAQINSANQGIRNLNDGVSLVQTAEGALSTVSQMTQRILTLATQGSNGTIVSGSDEAMAIEVEMTNILTSIELIQSRTTFGSSTDSIFSGEAVSITATSTIDDYVEISETALATIDADITVGADGATDFTEVIADATTFLSTINAQRAALGAAQNQLEFTIDNVIEFSANTSAARSRVTDTDYATETASLTKGQILQQAATAMLAQANQMPNVILSLLK